MKIWNGKSLLNSVRSMIPSTRSTSILHIILLDLTRNLVRNPSLTTILCHPRTPIPNLNIGLIGTESLLPLLLDSLSLCNKNERTSQRKEHAFDVGNQVMFWRIAQIGNERYQVQQALLTRNPHPRLRPQLNLLSRKLLYHLRKVQGPRQS